MKTRSSRAANLLLGAAGVLIALLLAEGGARLLLGRPSQPFPETQFAKVTIVRNRENFRDFVYPEKKPPGVFRVVAVGDSFTEGDGVNFDDIWPKRLERYLNEYRSTGGLRYEVLNMGLSATATPQQLRTLKEDALRFHPDLVVLGYCLNDAEDEQEKQGFISTPRYLYNVKRWRGTGLRAQIYDHSALYRLVLQRILNTRLNRAQLEYYRGLYHEDFSGWRKTRAAFAELGRFGKGQGLPVAVMIFPLFSWEFDDAYPLKAVHDALHHELDAAGLPYLDLLPVYHGIPHSTLEAVPFKNPHPNDVALRLAAEKLLFWLGENGLLPTLDPAVASASGRRVAAPW